MSMAGKMLEDVELSDLESSLQRNACVALISIVHGGEQSWKVASSEGAVSTTPLPTCKVNEHTKEKPGPPCILRLESGRVCIALLCVSMAAKSHAWHCGAQSAA